MRFRPALLAALLLPAAAGPAAAQPAAPPDRAALDRLNLRTEWSAFLPLEGHKDAIASVQPVDDTQVFVQTRAGLLVALDAVSGAKQWTFHYPTAYATVFPVAVNENYVFAVNVSRLFCLHRYTGVIEFDYEVKLRSGRLVVPTAGPVADRELVYLPLNGSMVVAYRFPMLVRLAERKPGEARTGGREPPNPADALAARYTLGGTKTLPTDEAFERPTVAAGPTEAPGAISAIQRTPSVSVLPHVHPPYTLADRALYATPSMAVVPTLRQPYQLKPDFMRFNQRTPSVSVIPPSIARSQELANLRPRGIEPDEEWIYSAPRRLDFQPLLVRGVRNDPAHPSTLLNRLWLTTDGPLVVAVAAPVGAAQVVAPLSDAIAAPIGGPLPYVRPDRRPTDPDARTQLGFLGLLDGSLLAIDLLAGDQSAARVEWRSNVGGLLNRRPVATPDAVYVAGDHAGVSRVDLQTGQVVWKTEPDADRVLAVNEEFVYVRDRVGNLLVYDRRRATDPQLKRADPLAKLVLSGFNVPVTNYRTDRILLGSDSGLLVCLRDASPKYARPFRITPPPPPPPAKKPEGEAAPDETPPPKKEEPKKEEPKKELPKKEEPKKGKDEKTG